MRQKARLLTIAMISLFGLVACQGTETTVTGGFGNDSVTGQVALVDDFAGRSPEGIEVRVVGTGLSVATAADGRFAIVGVPSERITLALSRADGVGGNVDLVAGDRVDVAIAVNARGASRSRRRGVGHPGVEIEGLIKSINGDVIVVSDASSKLDLEVKVVDTTIIRKGNRTLALADLKVGDRVHVKARFIDDVRTAVEIKLQNPDDDDGDDDDQGTTMTANGRVQEVGSDFLIVKTSSGRVIKVMVDARTIIKRKGRPFPLAEIKVGDKAESLGTRIDDTTMLARKIETQAGK